MASEPSTTTTQLVHETTPYMTSIPSSSDEAVKKKDEHYKFEDLARKIKNMIIYGAIKNTELWICRTNGDLERHHIDFSKKGVILYSFADDSYTKVLSHPTIQVFVGPGDLHKDVMIERLIQLNPEWVESLGL